MSKQGWIGVDLDGTLAYYDMWRGVEHIGPPIPEMVKFVSGLIYQGHTVKIFTARVSCEGEEKRRAEKAIEKWCLATFGITLPITCCKDFGMITLYDDRCVTIEKNTGRILTIRPKLPERKEA